MRDKEIEKQAEKYIKEYYKSPNSVMNIDGITEVLIKQAYKDAAKWGAKHSAEWHNLKKDPNDLPPRHKIVKNMSVRVYTDRGKLAFYNFEEKVWIEAMLYHVIVPPTMWCELPKFEGK